MNETGREQDMLYMEELERVTEDRDRLREALEDLTSTCERKHRIVHMGWAFDKYEFAFSTDADNPVKRARAALKEVDDGR